MTTLECETEYERLGGNVDGRFSCESGVACNVRSHKYRLQRAGQASLSVGEIVLVKDFLRDIHRYWFGELNSPHDFRKDTDQLWFDQSEETDRHIRETYGHFIPEAAAIDWNLCSLTREEDIALIVLLDQFPRNVFRNSREAFATDAKALEIARGLIAGGIDRFFPIERDALALVFQHHEGVAEQDYSVSLTAELAVNGPECMREFHRTALDFATKHRDIIRRFGRYPHRNALLGRPSSPAEVSFLNRHERGF